MLLPCTSIRSNSFSVKQPLGENNTGRCDEISTPIRLRSGRRTSLNAWSPTFSVGLGLAVITQGTGRAFDGGGDLQGFFFIIQIALDAQFFPMLFFVRNVDHLAADLPLDFHAVDLARPSVRLKCVLCSVCRSMLWPAQEHRPRLDVCGDRVAGVTACCASASTVRQKKVVEQTNSALSFMAMLP